MKIIGRDADVRFTSENLKKLNSSCNVFCILEGYRTIILEAHPSVDFCNHSSRINVLKPPK